MIEYRLRFPDLRAHLVEVEVTAEAHADEVAFALPAWSPGSYLVRDYARNVRDFAGFAGGSALPAEKRDKQTFVVAARGQPRVGLRYRVYAHELTVRTSHVDARHAFLHGPSLLMYLPGRINEPATLALEAPPGWQVATTLPRAGEAFRADDYHHLVDCPIELAPELTRIQFSACDTPHELAICGRADGPIPETLADDAARIVATAAAIFGGLPYERYLFLLHLAGGAAAGGLEHRDSAALLAAPSCFRPRKAYEDLLELVAHEHFHAWNVKRIRPRALARLDYAREAYTGVLWLCEGVTSYYDRHLLVRAGLVPPKRFLEKLGEELARLALVPGRHVQSLAESSFDAWIKFYKPDEATPNATVSYYLKGGLVALALDLHIRAATAGKRSLDDAVRALWQEHGRSPDGFDEVALRGLWEAATGVPLANWFAEWIDGRGEPDFAGVLALAGLSVEPQEPDDPDAPTGAWLGAETREVAGGRAQLATVLSAGPAEQAGLAPGDELIALDGLRVDARTLRDRLAARQPGERARIHVLRRDELIDLWVTLGARPPERFAVKPAASAGDPARALYQAWLGEPHPG
jgi:predicted metalloprotease with PDZ domain